MLTVPEFSNKPLLATICGDVKSPNKGLYLYLVELVYTVDNVPLVVDENKGYLVAFVVVSSVIVAPPVNVTQVGTDVPFDCNI